MESSSNTADALFQLAGGESVTTPSREKPGGSDKQREKEDENQDPNGSWDLDVALANNPKMSRLLHNHSSDTENVLSYHGT